ERADDSADAGRVPRLAHRVAGTLGCHRQAIELARKAHGEIADVDHLLHFAETLLQDLARFERDQCAEVLLGGAKLLAEKPDELAASRRRYVAPDSECGIGAFDHR